MLAFWLIESKIAKVKLLSPNEWNTYKTLVNKDFKGDYAKLDFMDLGLSVICIFPVSNQGMMLYLVYREYSYSLEAINKYMNIKFGLHSVARRKRTFWVYLSMILYLYSLAIYRK